MKKQDKKYLQKYIREEVLAQEVTNKLQKVSLSSAWAEWMLNELNKEETAQQAKIITLQKKSRHGTGFSQKNWLKPRFAFAKSGD